jgi:hypothetical protein
MATSTDYLSHPFAAKLGALILIALLHRRKDFNQWEAYAEDSTITANPGIANPRIADALAYLVEEVSSGGSSATATTHSQRFLINCEASLGSLAEGFIRSCATFQALD